MDAAARCFSNVGRVSDHPILPLHGFFHLPFWNHHLLLLHQQQQHQQLQQRQPLILQACWKQRHGNATMPPNLRLPPVFLNATHSKCPLAVSPSGKRSYNSATLIRASSQEELSENYGHSSPSISISEGADRWEARIEQAIFDFRFLTLFAVIGSLAGSIICFLKGSAIVVECFKDYFINIRRYLGAGQTVLLLIEAIDVYLTGTVMLILGMGLHDLFVSSLNVPEQKGGYADARKRLHFSSLFGLFPLTERPRWLRMESLSELKQTLGHAIVMILLVGMFEKSKKVPIHSALDLLCFSTSIILTSGCLYLLSKLN